MSSIVVTLNIGATAGGIELGRTDREETTGEEAGEDEGEGEGEDEGEGEGEDKGEGEGE